MMNMDETLSTIWNKILFKKEALTFNENRYIWNALQAMQAEIVRLTENTEE